MKHQCQFNEVGDRCPEPATRKWGDHWFCETHGARTKPEPPTTHRTERREMSELFRIKPLAWVYAQEAAFHRANTIAGSYWIHRHQARLGNSYSLSGPFGQSDFGKYASLKDAKAAAEADFRNRLMAHLEEVK